MPPFHRIRSRPLRAALASLTVGAGVLILVWHAATFRLEISGAQFTWPALIAFGAAWTQRRRGLVGPGVGMITGVVVSILTSFAVAGFLPGTPLALGIGLGAGALVLALICLELEWLRLEACTVGYGIGVATVQTVGITFTTGAADAIALVSALSLAVLIGLMLVRVGDVLGMLVRPESPQAAVRRPELMPAEADATLEITSPRPVDLLRPERVGARSEPVGARSEPVGARRAADPGDEVFGPLLEPPTFETARRSR